jgi:hypothetical protein
MGLTYDITPWYAVPNDGMRDRTRTTCPWDSAMDAAEQNIVNNTDPNNGGKPFANLEAYGTYIEQSYHNRLHCMAQQAYGETSIGPVASSPTSTYFFKIHGLVEYYFLRYQYGDYNHDGHSDIMVRNSVNPGDFWLEAMNGELLAGSSVNLGNVGYDSCNWQAVTLADMGGWKTGMFGPMGTAGVGATAANPDGENDIIWRGAGCGGISIWFLNGDGTFKGSVDSWGSSMGIPALPGVGGDWTIVGTGDFNNDDLRDIVWQSQSNRELSIWLMDGAKFSGNYFTVPLASDELSAFAVGNYPAAGLQPINFKAGTASNWHIRTKYFQGSTLQSTSDFTGLTFGTSPQPNAMAHYAQSATGVIYNMDIVWDFPPGGGTWNFSKCCWAANTQTLGNWGTYILSGPH